MMKNYKIVFSTNNRTRISLPFKVTPDIKNYMESLVLKKNNIYKIHFYNDNKHIAIYHNRYDYREISIFLKSIDIVGLKECYEYPKLIEEETPYNIISKAFYKRTLVKLLVPNPLRHLGIIYNSVPFAIEAYNSLKQKKLNMSVLDGLAIFVSIFIGDFKSASAITFLLNLGTELEGWSKSKSLTDLSSALNKADDKVWTLINNSPIEISVLDVKKGDSLIFYEGSEILFDGIVIDGEGFVDESSITGELYLVSKHLETEVHANTLLTNGELTISVTNETPNSGIIKMLDLIKKSELQSSSQQNLLVKYSDRLVKFNFLGMLITFILTKSIPKMLSFLMVDFSCSIKLSTPVAYLSAIKEALENNILVKSSSILDTYQTIDTFIFDKTGTITTSQPEIKNIIAFNKYTETDVLRIGACLEEHIYHPIANALVSEAEKKGIIHEEMHGELFHIASKGLKSSIDNLPVVIGSIKFMQEEKVYISNKQNKIIEKYAENYNLLYLGYNKELVAIFIIDTPIRTDTNKTIDFLKQNNKQVVLLTGDNKLRTKSVAEGLFFDEVFSDLTPEDKFNYVQNLKSRGKIVAMVGDGLNDSAAISLADVGISMGESSDVSQKISDITLLSNELSGLIYIDSMVNRLSKKVRENLRLTFSINSSLIILGLFDILTPSTLSTIHNMTTFFLIGNSFKLKK